jgi:hypothetical protein
MLRYGSSGDTMRPRNYAGSLNGGSIGNYVDYSGGGGQSSGYNGSLAQDPGNHVPVSAPQGTGVSSTGVSTFTPTSSDYGNPVFSQDAGGNAPLGVPRVEPWVDDGFGPPETFASSAKPGVMAYPGAKSPSIPSPDAYRPAYAKGAGSGPATSHQYNNQRGQSAGAYEQAPPYTPPNNAPAGPTMYRYGGDWTTRPEFGAPPRNGG